MSNKNDKNNIKNRLNSARMILYDLQVFVKFGALASDSNIIDENLQINKGSDDFIISIYNHNFGFEDVQVSKQKDIKIYT